MALSGRCSREGAWSWPTSWRIRRKPRSSRSCRRSRRYGSVERNMRARVSDCTRSTAASAVRPVATASRSLGWSHKLHEAVATGLTAEAAVERVQSDTRARMLRSTDPYLRDRLHDLEDLGFRLMRQLVGQDHAPAREHLPDNAILLARAMGPAALLDYDRKRLRGLVLEEGTANSHVSIVARALGIPAVGEVPNAPGIADPGDAIIVDGTSGEIYVRPSAEIEAAYAERVRFRARRQAQYSALRDLPCQTRDGQGVELLINAG